MHTCEWCDRRKASTTFCFTHSNQSFPCCLACYHELSGMESDLKEENKWTPCASCCKLSLKDSQFSFSNQSYCLHCYNVKQKTGKKMHATAASKVYIQERVLVAQTSS